MSRTCDLHTHSIYSDGTLSPAELIRMAEALNLAAVALCDHNTVAGLPEFLDAAKGSPVEPVPGIEFSTDYQGTELHILGLFIAPQHYAAITEKVDEMMRRKEQSNIALVDALKAAGIPLDYAAIKAGTPNGQVNRAVIAAEMVRLGYCGTVKEAFSRWLSPKRGFFRPPQRLDAFDVIRFIKSIGAVAVLAHPFLNLDGETLRIFLKEASVAGLDAMEAYYPLFSGEETGLARRIAEEYGLLLSGGSDFHGANKPDIRMGSGKGALRVPRDVLDKLQERKAQSVGKAAQM